MKYEEKLWNGFEAVYNYFQNKRKGFKDFIYLLNEAYKYEIDYAKGMKKIYDLNYYITNEGTLGNCSNDMKEYFHNKYINLTEYANYVKNDVIEPARKFLDNQLILGKKFYTDFKKFEKDYHNAIALNEKNKIKFHGSAKAAENSKIDSECARLSYIHQSEKDKFHNKFQNFLKEAKEAEKNYLSSISAANSSLHLYVENGKNILQNFQFLEEELIDYAKNTCRKFFIFSNSCNKNINDDIEKMQKVTESISLLDINDFISKNITNKIPPQNIEYIPYSIALRQKSIEQHPYSIETVFNVIVTFQENFIKIDGEYFDPVEEKKKLQITELSKLVCNGINYTDDNKNLLFSMLKEKKHRIHFLSYLNKYRSSGQFEITKICYENVGDIMNQILDEVISDKDYESARYCLILSQTYHYMDENGKKCSLQEKIDKHELFRAIDFWGNFIAYSIFEEIEKQNNFRDNNETDDDKNHRIGNIVFSQLLPITDNMLNFMINKETIKDLISGISKQYNLSSELDQHLTYMVEDYKYSKREEEKISEISLDVSKGDESNSNREFNTNEEEKDIFESYREVNIDKHMDNNLENKLEDVNKIENIENNYTEENKNNITEEY